MSVLDKKTVSMYLCINIFIIFVENKIIMKKIHINNDDNYATPPELYNELNKEFNFDFDPCPYNENPITPETDGLLKEWGKSNFVNPPYSQKLKEAFVLKAIEEMRKGKCSVFLIPVSTSTKLWHEIIRPNVTEFRFIKGRVKFGKRDIDGNFIPSKSGGTKDSMIVIFNHTDLPPLDLDNVNFYI